MKIFISWSGKYSQECAEILKEWIKCALQASEPWISSKDLDKGSLWFTEISDQLKDTKVGIVCLTKGNKEKPWILFESGALAKGLSTSRVCTFLINLKPSDLEGPLSQFNHTVPDADGMKSLLITINKELGESALEDKTLEQVFQAYWPSFEEKFNKLKDSESPESANKPSRSNDDILEEILYTTRKMDKRIRSLEGDGRHPRFLDRGEVMERIEKLFAIGSDPDEIVEKLRGYAPPSIIMRLVKEHLAQVQPFPDDDNDEEVPF